jgi:hypothetical protein
VNEGSSSPLSANVSASASRRRVASSLGRFRAELLGRRLQRGGLIKLRGAMDLLWWPSMLAGG